MENWIEKQATTEEFLRKNAEGCWQTLRAAIQDCCASYSARYKDSSNGELECKPENGYRLLLTIILQENHNVNRYRAETRHLLISYDPKMFAVSVTAEKTPTSPLRIVASEDSIWFENQQKVPVDQDQATRIVLENFLFGRHPKPVEASVAAASSTHTLGWMR